MPSTLLGPLGTLARTTNRARLASSQGRAGQHRDAQTHWLFAVQSRSTRSEENKEFGREREPMSHFTGLHHEIYLAGDLLHAGWLEAGALQPAAARPAPIGTGQVLASTYVRTYGGSFDSGSDGQSLARRHHQAKPSGTENASRPALPGVARGRDGVRSMADERLSKACRLATKFLDRISSEASHRRFSFVMPGGTWSCLTAALVSRFVWAFWPPSRPL